MDKQNSSVSIKSAISICLSPNVLKEILCLFGSEYDTKSTNCKDDKERKIVWHKTVELKAEEEEIQARGKEDALILILPIARRILDWVVFHETTFQLSRYFIAENSILNEKYFNQEGLIDAKKLVEDLLKDNRLPIVQRFQLSCYYFIESKDNNGQLVNAELWKELNSSTDQEVLEERQKLGDIIKTRLKQKLYLVTLWAHFYQGTADQLTGGKPFWHFAFEKALKAGNEIGLKYCWQKLDSEYRDGILMDSAIRTLKYKEKCCWNDMSPYKIARYTVSNCAYVLFHNYLDCLLFLFAQMQSAEQKTDFVKRLTSINYDVFYMLLDWPYQNLFQEVVTLAWKWMTEDDFANHMVALTYRIEKIRDERYANHVHGEHRSFDYRKLLRNFWCRSPNVLKRSFFSHKSAKDPYFGNTKGSASQFVFRQILSLEEFTPDDKSILVLIYKCATGDEKEAILFSVDGIDTFLHLFQNDKLELLKELLTDGIADERISQFHEKVLGSNKAKQFCQTAVLNGNFSLVDQLLDRCSGNKMKMQQFKKDLAAKNSGLFTNAIGEGQWEKFVRLVGWFFTTNSEIANFKKQLLANKRKTCFVFKDLMCANKWEEVELFLQWLFSSSAKEIDDFKREFLKMSASVTHFDLISENKWDQAEVFFKWLKLDGEELKKLKRDTIFNNLGALCKKLIKESGVSEDVQYSDKHMMDVFFNRGDDIDQETLLQFQNVLDSIEKLVRWNLSAPADVSSFKSKVEDHFSKTNSYEYKYLKTCFYSVIDKILKDEYTRL